VIGPATEVIGSGRGRDTTATPSRQTVASPRAKVSGFWRRMPAVLSDLLISV